MTDKAQNRSLIRPLGSTTASSSAAIRGAASAFVGAKERPVVPTKHHGTSNGARAGAAASATTTIGGAQPTPKLKPTTQLSAPLDIALAKSPSSTSMSTSPARSPSMAAAVAASARSSPQSKPVTSSRGASPRRMGLSPPTNDAVPPLPPISKPITKLDRPPALPAPRAIRKSIVPGSEVTKLEKQVTSEISTAELLSSLPTLPVDETAGSDEPVKPKPPPVPVPRRKAESVNAKTEPRLSTSGPSSKRATPARQNSAGPVKSEKSHMTPFSLADAIMGAHLASSRAHSPPKFAEAMSPSKVTRGHSLLHHRHESSGQSEGRRPMRHTLRKPHGVDVDEDDETGIAKRGRSHFFKKHPNKHHEGDRKRWRDKITERERRRYEGVWAANRGLYLFWDPSESVFGSPNKKSGGAGSERVLNLVVRDIWERSRLPPETLEEIWDLVDRTGSNSLSRDEFVVGLWLIDQRLKGRKLPVKVSLSVWGSVRHAHGVKMPTRQA